MFDYDRLQHTIECVWSEATGNRIYFGVQRNGGVFLLSKPCPAYEYTCNTSHIHLLLQCFIRAPIHSHATSKSMRQQISISTQWVVVVEVNAAEFINMPIDTSHCRFNTHKRSFVVRALLARVSVYVHKQENEMCFSSLCTRISITVTSVNVLYVWLIWSWQRSKKSKLFEWGFYQCKQKNKSHEFIFYFNCLWCFTKEFLLQSD